MYRHTEWKRQSNMVILVFVLAVMADKYCVSKIIPGLSGLIEINPIPVVLGIPVGLPINFGLVTVFILFAIFYSALILPYQELNKDQAWGRARKKLWAVSVGMAAIPFCMLTSGLIYFFAYDHLPKNLRNSIESFGLNTDITILYPGNGITHFRGSLVILAGFLLGVYIFIRQMKKSIPVSRTPSSSLELPVKPVANRQDSLEGSPMRL